ncbi:MAG TPA: type III secretion system cytoplasmic ring protein SctQ, partial [Opitutales bacterium]|nr:type III secretion system cytoplasmic ring protein SctQ [Opitutales bacterium]
AWSVQSTPGSMRLHWQWKDDQQSLLAEGLLELQPEQLALLTSLLEGLPLVDSEVLVEAIKWDVRLELGRTLLGGPDFKTLRLGDVIIFDDQAKAKEGDVCVWVDEHIIYKAKLQDNIITLKTMSENPDALAAKSILNPESQLEALPVTVSFELGRKRLSLKEVKALGPGFTFEFEDIPMERPITILANGVNVGTGALVQVGEVFGVRVVGWSATAETPKAKVTRSKAVAKEIEPVQDVSGEPVNE